MSEAIIVAIIMTAGTLLGQWLITRKNRREADAADAAKNQRINDRLERIEEKLDIHNGYAEKLGDIQRDIAVLRTEIIHLKGE